jgi:hypothetical protein
MTEYGFAGDESGGQPEKVYGKYPGVVRDNKPPAGQAHVGELLVEVPGILEETPDGAGERGMQVWARPCFVPGFYFIPEVGAPVWVEFAAGEIDQPLWTGVWYPGAAVPQTADGQAPTEFQKVIRTAAGHVIMLDDTANQESVVICHKSGSRIEIDKTGKITIEDAGNDTSIASNKISLGTKGGAAESMVLGDTLKAELEKLIDIVLSHDHPTGVGPSGPPASKVGDLSTLRAELSQILSQKNTTD